MLQLKLKQTLREAGVQNSVAWLSNMLKCSRNKAFKLLHGKKKTLNTQDISAICYYLNCTPNQLFVWDKQSKFHLKEEHCLNSLIPHPTPSA